VTAPQPRARPMIVAGVMSGTSADGIDVALCRISPSPQQAGSPRVKLLGVSSLAYPKGLRDAVLKTMEGAPLTAAEMSRLHWRLGDLYASAIEKAATKFSLRVALVGCHGQTVHHQPTATQFHGANVRSTWQIGEAAVLAERLRCTVVSDFRPADLAADGQGAPLVPMLDWCLFRSARVSRVLLNLGGIANLTAIPAASGIAGLIAFDTGPANMVIDHCMQQLFAKPFDRNGATARQGHVLQAIVHRMLQQPYFSSAPPKSCGREEFGAAFANRFIAICRAAGATESDTVATATALTAQSVLDAYRRFVWPHLEAAAPLAKIELCVAGGGAKNRILIQMLTEALATLGVKIRSTDEMGVPSQSKEAIAFALLAWLTWHRLPGNVPAATGAHRPAVLGKVSFG
jgi:anhydro-N-acetylmuramic acid kinase